LTALTAMAPCAHAQEFHRNAYGMYAAPTIYGLAKGSEYEVANSDAGLDLGAYYARAFTESFSGHVELRYGTRNVDYGVQWVVFPTSYYPIRLSESILEVPVLVEGDRRLDVDNHELRVSVGGGISYKYVIEQKILGPGGEFTGAPDGDGYQKLGVLFDGGVTLGVNRKSAVFLRLRVDWDVSTFGEPEDDTLVRRFWAAGFYAGFEYGI